ncbi:hypothetical protein [Methylotenera sp.]|uniref:hypothetical protein n=1 Tax=Methylotenera sp. TaxID=2051956 RepID=UPI002EDA20DE
MKLDQAIKTLEAHNQWRRGRLMPQHNPTEIGMAIDVVLRAAKEHQTLSMVMNQIADKPRKTKEQRLAKSCVMFLESMG